MKDQKTFCVLKMAATVYERDNCDGARVVCMVMGS